MTTPTKRATGLSRILLMLAFVAIAGAAQAVSIFVRPVAYYCSQTAANKIRFDVFVKNVGADELGYRSHTLRFTMNRAVLPAGALAGGTTQYVAGTGDPRLSLLQATFNGASSFSITATTCQVNLGGGGTIYNEISAPRVLPGDSIWLGTFEVTAPVPWVAGTSSNPAWLVGTPVSISVYDLPPSTNIATVCNSTGTGLSISSGQLQNGIISTNNPTGLGQPPCTLLLNGCAFAGAPAVVDASCGVTPTGSISVSVTGSNGLITYTLNPGAVVIGPTAATTATFSGLLPGVYTVTYSDGVGCGQTTADITINPGSGPASDGDLCTQDICNSDGSTSHPPIPGISDDDACTVDACNPLTGDITHNPNPLIDDGNACTTDACNTLTGDITHTNVIPEDDGNACTQDVCLSTGGTATLLNETFDNFPTGWSIFNVDGFTPATAAGLFTDAWVPANLTGFPTNPIGASISWYSPAGTADDWMVSPAINTGGNTTLEWDAIALDTDFPDGYEVRLFTSPPTLANLMSSTVLLTVPAENDVLTHRTLSLSGYQNQTVYIAFRNNSNDMYILVMDNIVVTNTVLAGSTVHIPIPPVSDGNACTADVCNSLTGATEYFAIPPVDDGNACTADVCNPSNGQTDHNPIPPVNDGNACTEDVCNSLNGQTDHNTIPPVNDNNACTQDVCNTVTGATDYIDLTVNDGNACTQDVCNIITGATDHIDLTVNDNNLCTDDVCNTLTGVTAHNDLTVDDGIACTEDVCNPSTGVTDHNPYAIFVNATPGNILCFGATTCVQVISAGGIGAITYGNGMTTNPSGIFCGVMAGGPYFYTATDKNGCTGTSNPVVISQPAKLEVDAIESTPSGCISNDGTATVYPSGGTPPYSFSWSPGGSTANPATGLGGGNYTVTITDANLCTATANVTVGSSGTSLPAPGPINGNTGACRNTSGVVYSVPATAGATYNWTVPANANITSGQGTSSITVSFNGSYMGGFICVIANNACGDSPSSCINVPVITSKAAKPTVSSATMYQHDRSIVCKGGVYVYCATSLRATSFTWKVDHGLIILAGQGTGCITVQVPANYDGGGDVKVRGVNCKGTGDEKKVELRLEKPKAPAMTGPSVVCVASTVVYCASAVSATSYNWVVDHGLVILAGQGTSCITVQVPAGYDGSGKVKVKGVNCNGIGAESHIDVKKTVPLVGAPVWDNSDNETSVCAPSKEKYKVDNMSNAECYTWTAPPGAVIDNGGGVTGNPLTVCKDGPNEVYITFPAGFTSGNVTVTASNACGSSATATLAVSGHPCRLAAADAATTQSAMNAYPNPTAGKLNVTFNAAATEKYTLKVVDLLGNVLVSEVNVAQEGSNLRELDLSGLAKGMYLISIERDAAQVQTMRIIVE